MMLTKESAAALEWFCAGIDRRDKKIAAQAVAKIKPPRSNKPRNEELYQIINHANHTDVTFGCTAVYDEVIEFDTPLSTARWLVGLAFGAGVAYGIREERARRRLKGGAARDSV